MAGTAVGRETLLCARTASRGRQSPRMETNRIMKRLFVASTLGLALAGCAQSRSALTKESATPPKPIAVTPVPSIYDTVNSGMGGPGVVRSAIKDPNDPLWAGRAQVAGTSRPGPAPGGTAPPGPAQPSASDSIAAAPAPLAADLSNPPAPLTGPAQPSAASTAPALSAATSRPGATSPAAPEVLPEPPPDLAKAPGDAGAPAAPGPGPSPVPISERPSPIDARPSDVQPATADAAAGVAGGPSPAPAPASPSAAPPARALRGGSDPLLGPNPDLMPPIPDLPPVTMPAGAAPAPAPAAGEQPAEGARPTESPELLAPSSAASPSPPAAPATAATTPAAGAALPAVPERLPALPEIPAVAPSPSPAPASEAIPIESAPAHAAPAGAPAGTESPPKSEAADPPAAAAPAAAPAPAADADKSTANQKPKGDGSVATVLPLEPAPPSSSLISAATARATAPGPAAPRRDAQVVLASADKPASESTQRKNRTTKPTGRPLARVGDEIITYHDLIAASEESLQRVPELMAAANNTGERTEVRNQTYRMLMGTLQSLIDRTLLAQEAKRLVKDPKMLDRVYEEADKVFHDNEVAPLQHRWGLDSEQQVNERLAEKGKSLDAMRKSFRQYFLAESYLHEKVKDHLKVELPELLRYYNERVSKHDFDRPAQITWRELLVEVSRCKSREEAQRKADGLLEKLRKGEDFAKLARAESDGLSSSRKDGGLHADLAWRLRSRGRQSSARDDAHRPVERGHPRDRQLPYRQGGRAPTRGRRELRGSAGPAPADSLEQEVSGGAGQIPRQAAQEHADHTLQRGKTQSKPRRAQEAAMNLQPTAHVQNLTLNRLFIELYS